MSAKTKLSYQELQAENEALHLALEKIAHGGLLRPVSGEYRCVYCDSAEENIDYSIRHKPHCVFAIAKRALTDTAAGREALAASEEGGDGR